MKKKKRTIEVEKEEIDERGNVVNKKMKSLENYKKYLK